MEDGLMNVEQETVRAQFKQDLLETLIRVVLVLFLLVVCVRVFMPFSHLVLVALILAISLYPLHVWLTRLFGGRAVLSVSAIVLAGLLLLGAPLLVLGGTVVTQNTELYTSLDKGTLALKDPSPKVAEIPIVGKPVHKLWTDAATNLPAFLKKNRNVVLGFSKKALSMAAGGAVALMVFLASIIVAGVLMLYAEGGGRVFERILTRLTDPVHGPRLKELCIATVRSVATGVVGVAFIQAILLGMGFLLAGVPAAGILALIVMFLGILQVPALLVSLPAVAWLWMGNDEGSTVTKVLFTVWFLVAGMADNVLKPLLLGRGVDAPMLVILIGAIGGMATGGLTGLFVGAVLLAVGYKIFMEWVDTPPNAGVEAPKPTSAPMP
jgi:predicted PurR-regulated permease PerM